MSRPVYWWPPVTLTGWECSPYTPQSRSVGLVNGRSFSSSWQRQRHRVTAKALGVDTDAAGAGYLNMLRRRLVGGALVRMKAHSGIWHLARSLNTNVSLEWTAGGVDLLWTAGGVDLLWSDMPFYGVPGTSGAWDTVAATGLPASSIVARPDEVLSRLLEDGTREQVRVMRVARSNASGEATIYVDGPLTDEGPISIGDTVEMLLEPLEIPSAVQPLGSNWTETWSFREVFEDEFPEGLTTTNPFGAST